MAAQVVSAAVATSYTFFFVDDFLLLDQARKEPFTLSYLRQGLFEHFSPVSRLLDKLLVVISPGSFVLAHGIELALYAAALIAFAFVIRVILGNTWTAFVACLLFGQSIFLMRLLNWWTATANILPSTIFMLLALGCYLRWLQTRSRVVLAGSLVAYAWALLDYETAILFPAYVAVVRLLVMERISARAWLAALWAERAAWVGYVVLAGAAAVNYYGYYYQPLAHRPSLRALGNFAVQALPGTFVPALFGIKYPEGPASHALTYALTAAVFVVVLGVTMYLRPRAWRCVVAFVIVFIVTMLPLGLARIDEFGVGVGRVIYYQQSLQFMFLVLAAYAVSPRWGGRRAAGGERTRRRWPHARHAALAGAAAAAAVYAALLITSLRAMSAASWQPLQAGAYVRAYLASDRRVEAATGKEPVLVDLTVPRRLMPRLLWPYTTYGLYLGLVNPAIRVDRIDRPLYIVSPAGVLVPTRYVPIVRGLIARASIGAIPGEAGPSRRDRSGCAPAGSAGGWLRVPLAHTRSVSATTYAIRVRFHLTGGSRVPIDALLAHGGPQHLRITNLISAGGGEVVALTFGGRIRALAFNLPPRACVTAVSVGVLSNA